MRAAPKIKPGTLYEKTSKAGRRYFVGRLGAARILLFSTGETTEDGTPIWELLAEQAEERPTTAKPDKPTVQDCQHRAR